MFFSNRISPLFPYSCKASVSSTLTYSNEASPPWNTSSSYSGIGTPSYTSPAHREYCVGPPTYSCSKSSSHLSSSTGLGFNRMALGSTFISWSTRTSLAFWLEIIEFFGLFF